MGLATVSPFAGATFRRAARIDQQYFKARAGGVPQGITMVLNRFPPVSRLVISSTLRDRPKRRPDDVANAGGNPTGKRSCSSSYSWSMSNLTQS